MVDFDIVSLGRGSENMSHFECIVSACRLFVCSKQIGIPEIEQGCISRGGIATLK